VNHLDATQKYEIPVRSDNRRSPGKVELSVRPHDRYPATTTAVANGNSTPTNSGNEARWLTRGPAGDWYYYDGSAWVTTSAPDGTTQEPTPSKNPAAPRRSRVATLMIVVGYVFAVVALLFYPPVFGGLGVFLGYRAKKLGSQKQGRALMITSGVCLAVGGILGVLVGVLTHHVP
jgi:hypothetical protein